MGMAQTTAVGDRVVVVHELTVGEVRDWIAAAEAGAQEDALQGLALDDCGLSDLARMSDISADELEAYTPSEMADLIAVCKEVNPHFFRVRAALSGVARLMLREAAVLASNAPPSFS